MERSVCTSGLLKMRASSITSAVPEPSSFAASPQPWPSMCAPTMYISSGCVVPTFVQNTSWRLPGDVGSASSARMRASGCASESVFTPVRARTPRRRPPPCAALAPRVARACALTALSARGGSEPAAGG